MKKEVIVVLYGSTGDLTFRKILPSLSKLIKAKKVTENFLILALGRREFDTKTYFEFIKKNNDKVDVELLENYTKYFKMQITNSSEYQDLKKEIAKYSDEKTKVIHYLAIAPEMMMSVAKNINTFGVALKNDLNHKLIFEKPFGSSYKTAHNINQELWKIYNENQIYRIDHYLGKKIIKEMIDFKFNNILLKPFFDPNNLDSVVIKVKEKDGILNRGSFYDETGVTRDMFQSHILQMISLVFMDKPKKMAVDEIIDEKVKVIKRISYNHKNIIFGQYNGYLLEDNIKENSLTDTLLQIELKINNKYRNTKITVLTGKKLDEKTTTIQLNQKDGSKLLFNIFPNNECIISTKIAEENLVLSHKFESKEDEYASLILDAINALKHSFVRFDEIEQSWKLTDEILSHKKAIKIYNIDDYSSNI